MPAGLLSGLIIALLTLLGVGARYYVHGDLNAIHGLFSLFFSTNLLICYWEACLYLRRDYIEKRAVYWRERRRETGRTPAVEFPDHAGAGEADPVPDRLGGRLGDLLDGG